VEKEGKQGFETLTKRRRRKRRFEDPQCRLNLAKSQLRNCVVSFSI
jgi:hypothetical protein